MRAGKPKIARCGMNRNTRARNSSWFMKLAGLRSLVSGGVFYAPSGRRGTRDVMSCETRAISNLARSFIGITLLGAMLLGAARVPAQETGQKHGSVKGTVSLVNATEERSTAERLLLELKSLAECAASFSPLPCPPSTLQLTNSTAAQSLFSLS